MEKKSATLDAKGFTVPFQLKSFDMETREFSGLASTWDVDLDGERFEKGAWTQTIKHFESSQKSATPKVIPIKDSHQHYDARSTFGKVVEMEETKSGLQIKARIVPSADGDEYLARIQGGYLNGLSVGFDTVKSKMETRTVNGVQRDIRVITEAKLMEVSVVDWGANPYALIGAKSLIREEKGRKSMSEFRDQLDDLLEEKAENDPVETPPADPLTPNPEPTSPAPAPGPKPVETPTETKPEPSPNPAIAEMEAEVAALEEKKAFAIEIEDYFQANDLKRQIAKKQSDINKYRQTLESMKPASLEDAWSKMGKLRLKKEADLAALLAEDGELILTA